MLNFFPLLHTANSQVHITIGFYFLNFYPVPVYLYQKDDRVVLENLQTSKLPESPDPHYDKCSILQGTHPRLCLFSLLALVFKCFQPTFTKRTRRHYVGNFRALNFPFRPVIIIIIIIIIIINTVPLTACPLFFLYALMF
jgi:hypothetical protein